MRFRRKTGVLVDRETIPDHWEKIKVEDVILSSRYGYTAKARKNIEGMIYLRISDINENGRLKDHEFKKVKIGPKEINKCPKYKLEPGDIVIARSGSVGQSYRYKERDPEMVFASYLIRFKPDPTVIIPSFFEYFLKTPIFWNWVNNTKRTSAQTNINATEIKNLTVPLPPLEEQEKIVEKLDEIFERIEKVQEAKEKSKQIEEDLFSLTAESLINKVTQDMNSKKLGNFIEVNPSYSHKDRSEYCMVPMKNVSAKKKDISKFDTRESIYSGLSKFKEGDVIFARITPSTENGKLALADRIPNNYGVCFGSTEFVVLHPTEEITPKYLYYLCRSRKFKKRAVASMKGSTGRKRVPYSFFRDEVEVPIPDVNTQEEIVEKLDLIKEKVNFTHDNSREITERLELLPKAVLRKAFSGEFS